MEPIILTSIIKTPNGINHSLVDSLILGEKVVDALTYEDSVILEQAMFEKLKTKYQSIYQGFSLEGELENNYYENSSGKKVKMSPTNSIETNNFFFDFKVGSHNHLFMRASFDSSDTETGYTNHKYWHKTIHKDEVKEFNIRIKNGVDKGNAYGTKTDDITRTYKVKSIKLIMQRLEEWINKFIVIANEKRPIYKEGVATRKQDVLDDARRSVQNTFREIYYDYVAIKKIVTKYESDHSEVVELNRKIITKGHEELLRLKELGSVAWIDKGCTEAENYKDLGVFQ